MDYSNFSTEDFIQDEAFIAWVKTGKGAAFWQNFAQIQTNKQATIAQAKALIEAAAALPIATLSENAKAEMWQRIDWRTTAEEATPVQIVTLRVPSRQIWWVAAASLTILTAASIWFFTSKRAFGVGDTEGGIYAQNIETAQSNSGNLKEWTNEQDEAQLIDLPDGSHVQLKKGSRLSFLPNTFNATRRVVFLSGEAFFDVAKNVEKPFFVYANETVTKVLGTSFTIRAFPKDAKVSVSVRTGKVSVFSKIDLPDTDNTLSVKANGVLLTPNQQAVFTRETQRIAKTLVESPQILPQAAATQFDFDFKETPVAQVFSTLAQAYGVSISFDEKILRGCTVTAPLAEETLFEKLDLICKVTRSSYEVFDGQIVVTSRGCR